MTDKKEYYTAGELAKLFGIPKQTMFYYDKLGLLTPEFVAENGYRYYAMPQYLTLEIILFLRKLDISVPHIKEFLEHRSRDEILNILKEREVLCRKTLAETTELLAAISSYRKTLECTQHLPLDRVLLQCYPESRMYMTPIPKVHRGGFDAIAIRARHVHEAFAHSFCKDQPTGWVISEEDFFSKNFKHSSAIVTQSGEEGSRLACNYIRPSGLYLSILTKGAYFLHAEEAYEKLSAFMEINRLAPDGDVFLFPIISYWATKDPDEYINSLSVKVKDLPPPEIEITRYAIIIKSLYRAVSIEGFYYGLIL